MILTKFARKVYMIHRRDQLRASKIMADRAKNNHKIEFLWNKTVVDVLGDNMITGIRLKDTVTGKESEQSLGGLFMAIQMFHSLIEEWTGTAHPRQV